MSGWGWAALDNGYHHNAKVIRLRRAHRGLEAIGLWTICLSWACADPKGWLSGRIPLVIVEDHARCDDWQELLDLLVSVGLWECDGERVTFRNWDEWNGPDAKQNRSRELGRARKVRERMRRCETGDHSKDCPTVDVDGHPWTCPLRAEREARKAEKDARHAASRDAGSGRVGSDRVGSVNPQLGEAEEPNENDPWAKPSEDSA